MDLDRDPLGSSKEAMRDFSSPVAPGYAIRLCVMNHTSGPADVEAALSWFASAPQPRRRATVSVEAYEDATADMKGGWGHTGSFDAEALRRLPLYSYAIVSGEAEVRGDREVLAELGPGEYFGELAALDWGAGFGYARTADVVAKSTLRVLVLPASALDELLRLLPDLDRRLRAAAHEYLARM